jgi:hypothetical protein
VLEINGSLSDDLVLKRTPQGEIIVSKKPDMSNVKPSKAQKAARARFAAASAYAAAALAHPEAGEHYRRLAKEQDTFPRNLAISDFYKGKNLLK